MSLMNSVKTKLHHFDGTHFGKQSVLAITNKIE